MAGTIEHKWNGTVLTITSDSGTSSADLKGAKGDDGARGPQGAVCDTTVLANYVAANAAPAGYGLGEKSARVVADANAAKTNGFYALSGESAINYPESYASFKYGSLLVQVRYTNTIRQTITYADISAKRYSQDGGTTWSEWAYENPPMYIGVEYRTTERWSGSTLYCKVVDFGALPNTSYKAVAHGITNFKKAIRAELVSAYSGTVLTNHVGVSMVDVGENSIQITTGRDMSAHQAYIRIWYTKN